MITPLFLGLDLGTTNAKAGAYDLSGKLVAAGSASYPTFYPQPGWAEQRIADWFAALSSAIRQLMATLGERKHDLLAIGLSAHGPGLVPIDASGNFLTATSPIWQDTRAISEGKWLLERIGGAWTGLGMALHSFPPQLKWLIDHEPALMGLTQTVLGIKDALTFWLTGEIATEPSQVVGGVDWSPRLIEACGWSLDRLPPVRAATDIVGMVRAALVESLGLPFALPVIPGLADGAAATLSMGAIQPQAAVLTLATSGVIRVVTDQPVAPALQLEHDLFCWHYLNRLWVAGGHIRSAASGLQWLRDLCPAQAVDHSLEQLLANAEQSPVGSLGIIFLPYLLGRGSPHADDSATAAFLGLTLVHQQADLTRALLEGVAFAYREVLDDFVQMGHEISHLRISGGGARSPLWRQILADVLNRPLHYYAADSTLGAAILATVAIGSYPDIQSAVAGMVRLESTTQPKAEQVEGYQSVFERYQALRNRLYS